MRRQDFNRRKPNDNRSSNNQRGLLDMPPSLMNNQTSLFGGQVGFMGGNQGGNQGGMMGQGNFLGGSGGLFDGGQGSLLGNQAGLFGNRGGGMMGSNPAALMATQAGLLGNQLGMLDNQGILGMTGQELLKNQNLLGMLASGNVGGLMGSQLNGLGLGLNNFQGSVNLGGNQSDVVASLLGEAVRSNSRARSNDWTRPNSGQAGILGPPPDAKKVMPLLSDNSAVRMRPPIGNKLMSSLQNSNFGGDLNRSNNPFGNTCDVCNWSYNSTYKKHCETLDHKKKARLVQKGCLLCKTGKFKNYPEYVKHLDSARHKQNKEQLNKDLEAKRKREEMEQSHDQTEKLPDNGSPIQNGAESKTVPQDDALHDVIILSAEDEMKMEGEAEGELCDFTPKADSVIYDPNVAIGQEHVISVTGFFCKLCRKFYNTELAAKVNHCKSEAHFLKYQETLKLK